MGDSGVPIVATLLEHGGIAESYSKDHDRAAVLPTPG
jgi:hypothetical protein